MVLRKPNGIRPPNVMCHFRATLLILTFVALNVATAGQHPNKSDTVKVNGYTLIFSATDSTQMTDIFGDGAIRLSMTDSIGKHTRGLWL